MSCPAGPLLLASQLAARGSLPLVASPIKMSATPVTYRLAPPMLGQHTDEVLRELKLALSANEGGAIDVDAEDGKLKTLFATELQRDLSLSYVPEHWTEAKLAD